MTYKIDPLVAKEYENELREMISQFIAAGYIAQRSPLSTIQAAYKASASMSAFFIKQQSGKVDPMTLPNVHEIIDAYKALTEDVFRAVVNELDDMSPSEISKYFDKGLDTLKNNIKMMAKRGVSDSDIIYDN